MCWWVLLLNKIISFLMNQFLTIQTDFKHWDVHIYFGLWLSMVQNWDICRSLTFKPDEDLYLASFGYWKRIIPLHLKMIRLKLLNFYITFISVYLKSSNYWACAKYGRKDKFKIYFTINIFFGRSRWYRRSLPLKHRW